MIATNTAAGARTPAAVSSALPIGSPLTIVADETVSARVRPGSEFRAHLRDPLVIGDTLVAIAGTPARLIVTTKDLAKDGSPRFHIAIVGLRLGLAGTLPVRPVMSTVDRIAAGMEIAATSLASVGYVEGKVRVAIPLPFTLSNEPPIGAYTPTPLRTAAPVINRRKPTRAPSPTPAPVASDSPAPVPDASPASAPPSPLPSPA